MPNAPARFIILVLANHLLTSIDKAGTDDADYARTLLMDVFDAYPISLIKLIRDVTDWSITDARKFYRDNLDSTVSLHSVGAVSRLRRDFVQNL